MLMDLRERLEHLALQDLARRSLLRMYLTVMFREERICKEEGEKVRAVHPQCPSAN